jgi:hypothetical protein
LKYYACIYPAGLWKTTKIFIQHNRSPRRELDTGPPVCEARLEIDDDENINVGSGGTREEKTLKYALRNP